MKCHRHKEVEATHKVTKSPLTRELGLCEQCKVDFEEIAVKWHTAGREKYEQYTRDKFEGSNDLGTHVKQVMAIYDGVTNMTIIPL